VKFASPLIHEGKIYVCDEIARMYCLDAKDGKLLWRHKYGRNSKGSPVWADGKIYITMVNGEFHVLKPVATACEDLCTVEFLPPANDPSADVELNGTPAIADGRIFFSTSFETYCVGKPDHKAAPATLPALPQEKPVAKDAKAAHLLVVPGDITLNPGEGTSFQVRAFDAHGKFLREVKGEYALGPMLAPPPLPKAPPPKPGAPAPGSRPPLQGELSPDGKFTAAKMPPGQFGGVTAKAEGLTGRARVRVAPVIPYTLNLANVPEGRTP